VGRRGNGEGSISRRKDGRWEARYTVHGAEGPKRKVLYGKTRGEVAKNSTRRSRTVRAGSPLTPVI
jgi:integrase